LPNHQRVAFASIVEDDYTSFDQYEGRYICIKGYTFHLGYTEPLSRIYISPHGSRRTIRAFVTVELPSGWSHARHAIAVSGTLAVNNHPTANETRYTLYATDIRPANTAVGLSPRAPWDGY
jgi:hypothetical protein